MSLVVNGTKFGANMTHSFVHEFEDDPRHSDLSVDLDPPHGASIKFDIENDREIWVSANRLGWEHLARICAEMAMQSELETGYHFHRGYDWSAGPLDLLEVSFELTDDTNSSE